MSQQLVKKDSDGRYSNVMPKSWIEAIKDKNTGQTLVEILQGFNMYFLPYNGNTSATRCSVPMILRKKGLWITYVKYDGNVYTEWYAASDIDDKSWGDSSNWRIGNNTLVGDITISSNGNWVINGTESEFKAVGEKGNTPLIRVANNRLQVSYDLGDTYRNATENPVYTQFRNYNNKIQVSTDLGATWTDASDEIAAYFRWQATTGDTQANNVGRLQISRDNETWTNLSNNIVNNLHISKYIGANEPLPTSGIAEGTIYAKGPTYAVEDTSNSNPIYRLWVYAWKGNTLAWQDNGEFTSIAAGIVQETGSNENAVMSQKATSKAIHEILYDVSARNDGAVFESLQALLSSPNLNTLIPISVRHGGMSIRFIQGSEQSSDNKYVQYRCVADEFTKDTNKWVICDGGVYVENPEWVIVKNDKKNRILYGVKSDGKFYFGEGCPQQVKEYVEERINTFGDLFVTKVTGKSLIDEIFASTQSVVESPEYLEVKKDSKNRIIEATRKDGKKELALPTDQDDILQKQIDVINNNLAVNNLENKKVITLAFISKDDNNHDEVVDNIKNNEWGLWYGVTGHELIYKTINGGIVVIKDTATLCSYKYNYAGTIFSIFQAQGYVVPQLCEDVKKPSHDILPDCKIHMINTMPDYTGETWDWTKAIREWSRGAAVYSIMQQSYAYLDALVLAYPNLITKYDPMASADYTEGGITVRAMPNIKTYMSNHGFNAYPFWYDGCDEGDYTVGEYTAHIKACPAFRTFVYKISQADNWYMYKQDNRRVRHRNLYVQAGVHGYENMGPVAACHLAKELVSTSDSAFSVLAHFDVYILPCLDGYNSLHGDYDGALGVNANRNYPTPWWREENEHWGKAAGDYFVTRLACAFIDTLNPDVAFDVHDQTPAVKDFGYFECGYHYTTHQMYHAYPFIASVVRNTAKFERYFGTKNQIPLMRNQDFPVNAAHAHDYFFAKGIRCGGVLELPSGINYTKQDDGTSVHVRTTANDFNQDTWELAGLLMINYVYKMCEYNINNF